MDNIKAIYYTCDEFNFDLTAPCISIDSKNKQMAILDWPVNIFYISATINIPKSILMHGVENIVTFAKPTYTCHRNYKGDIGYVVSYYVYKEKNRYLEAKIFGDIVDWVVRINLKPKYG